MTAVYWARIPLPQVCLCFVVAHMRWLCLAIITPLWNKCYLQLRSWAIWKLKLDVHAELTPCLVVLYWTGASSTAYSAVMETTHACSWEGAGGQKDDMHLTLHAGPRMQHDYQALSLTMVRSHLLLMSHMHASYALRHAFYPLCHDYQALHSPHAYTHLHTKYIFHAECNCISTCIYVMVKRILMCCHGNKVSEGHRATKAHSDVTIA